VFACYIGQKNTFSKQVVLLPPPFSGSLGVEKAKKVTSFRATQHFNSVRGFLLWGFLNPRPTVKGSSPPSPKLPVASSSTMVVKDDWMKGSPPPLGGCTYHNC
jgi:hypothetical protein